MVDGAELALGSWIWLTLQLRLANRMTFWGSRCSSAPQADWLGRSEERYSDAGEADCMHGVRRGKDKLKYHLGEMCVDEGSFYSLFSL